MISSGLWKLVLPLKGFKPMQCCTVFFQPPHLYWYKCCVCLFLKLELPWISFLIWLQDVSYSIQRHLRQVVPLYWLQCLLKLIVKCLKDY